MPYRATPQFSDVWKRASDVSGWLTEKQAQLLWETADQMGTALATVQNKLSIA